jgi:hypothetical protein
MAVTVHDITMNADAFKRAYPRWPSAEADPLALPPVTGRELADYRDMPGYAVPWPPRAAPEPNPTTHRMTRLLAGED